MNYFFDHMGLPFSFAVDISGMLPDQDSVLGLIAIPLQRKSALVKRFNRRFSHLLNKKGKKLKREDLHKILIFLNDHDVSMVAIKCTRVNWSRRFTNIPKYKSYKKEKLYGILYFLALKELSEKGGFYDVVVCKDSFMRIDKALIACKKLADHYGFNYNFSSSSGNLNPMVKIADYVAAIGRKFRSSSLEDFENFKLLVTDIPYKYVRYVFDLYENKK